MFLAMDSQAVMAGTHDQNVEMNVQKARKLRGVNSVDLNKTALRIPVPGTSAFSPRLHPAAGTVPQRRLTEGSPLEVGLLFRTPRSSASSSLGVYRCVSNREREAERPGGKDAYKTKTRLHRTRPEVIISMGDYGWSRDSVASQGNEVVVDGWVLYTQRG